METVMKKSLDKLGSVHTKHVKESFKHRVLSKKYVIMYKKSLQVTQTIFKNMWPDTKVYIEKIGYKNNQKHAVNMQQNL